jgi:hypothetical protein
VCVFSSLPTNTRRKTGLPCDSIPILAILYHMTTYEDASYHNYMQTADSSVLYFDKRACRTQ